MAIEIKQQKQSKLGTILLIIVVLAILGWLGWNFLKPIEIFQKPSISDLLPDASQELIYAELNIGRVFDHSVFKTLTSHIVWPLEIPDLGRANPFQSF
ncbi:MAG: hypothetical protein PHU82_01580 [Candidatus Pacebacteria bacterium]|jgi:hypothetical protein|nr:hypothetical protein [Candidatus Paceibacterota bacterium]MDD4994689.1 hypothetical protein [Candidatus Paceibacterota bacterium]MDD5535390.1 hypothetical protein [Candidatus Paceibacterota bacterium]